MILLGAWPRAHGSAFTAGSIHMVIPCTNRTGTLSDDGLSSFTSASINSCSHAFPLISILQVWHQRQLFQSSQPLWNTLQRTQVCRNGTLSSAALCVSAFITALLGQQGGSSWRVGRMSKGNHAGRDSLEKISQPKSPFSIFLRRMRSFGWHNKAWSLFRGKKNLYF